MSSRRARYGIAQGLYDGGRSLQHVALWMFGLIAFGLLVGVMLVVPAVAVIVLAVTVLTVVLAVVGSRR